MSGKLDVFVSYSHRDKTWLERVQVHLKPLARNGRLDLWDDTRIRTGQRWREEIKAALTRADVAVLLISADFYASDFIAKNELPPLLEAARSERGLVIAGVHINYSRFDRDRVLSEYQTVNTPDRPIEDLSKATQEKVFDALARRIEELLLQLDAGPPAAGHSRSAVPEPPQPIPTPKPRATVPQSKYPVPAGPHDQAVNQDGGEANQPRSPARTGVSLPKSAAIYFAALVGIVVSGAGVWWWSTSDQAVQTKPEAHSFPVQALRPEPEAPEVKPRPIEAEVDGALIALSGRYPEPGSVFKDCENCPEMVVVVGGNFNMGSPESEEDRDKDEGPQHEVTIQSFAIGRYEVTFEEWDACVAAGGCSTKPRDVRWGRGKRPVITVGWNDAREYIAWLKEKTNQPYRLSSEAEWEYAARAGTTTPLWTGAMITVDQANYVRNVEKTTEVGAYAANALGLYDTAGNVSEWVEDCWHDNYENAPEDGSAWLKGDCFGRVVRGGSWSSKPKDLRSAARYWSRPNARRPDVGFRVARTLTP